MGIVGALLAASRRSGRRVLPPGAEENAFSVKQRVDVVLRCMTDVAVRPWTVQQPGVAFPMVNDGRSVCPDSIDAAPDIHHDDDVVFDEFHRGHHLADAPVSYTHLTLPTKR